MRWTQPSPISIAKQAKTDLGLSHSTSVTPESVAPGIWRLELPSRTLPPYRTTNTYLVEDRGVGIVVDPGFHEAESLEQVLATLDKAQITFLKAVLLTHTHGDHVAGLELLQDRWPDLPVYAHPNELDRLEATNLQALNAERTVMVGNIPLHTVFTPGHSPGHLSFYNEESSVALVGDLLAQQGSTWVGLPEGDVSGYLSSLDRLDNLRLKVIGPGHGELIHKPKRRIDELRRHRLERLEQTYRALEAKPLRLGELREAVYPGVTDELARFSEYSLLALLKKLMNDLRVVHLGEDEQGPYATRR